MLLTHVCVHQFVPNEVLFRMHRSDSVSPSITAVLLIFSRCCTGLMAACRCLKGSRWFLSKRSLICFKNAGSISSRNFKCMLISSVTISFIRRRAQVMSACRRLDKLILEHSQNPNWSDFLSRKCTKLLAWPAQLSSQGCGRIMSTKWSCCLEGPR